MKIQIDLKSALFGLALGIVAVVCVGADGGRQAGRFQAVTGITGNGGYALILDTATGKVWGRAKDFAHDADFFDLKPQ